MPPLSEGDPIPDPDHVARHLRASDVELGVGGDPIVGLAALRVATPGRESLSVYHLEPVGPADSDATIVRLTDILMEARRSDPACGREVRPNHMFGLFNCGSARSLVARNVEAAAPLHIESQPRRLVECHAGIRALTDEAGWVQVAIQLRSIVRVTKKLRILRESVSPPSAGISL